MNKRHQCMEYIASNYKEWPTPSQTSHTVASHCGYSWTLNGCWVLENAETEDVITEKDLESFKEGFNLYSENSLRRALVDVIPNGDVVMANMSLPNAVNEAVICLFRRSDLDSPQSKLIRVALEDLTHTGQFNFHDRIND